MPAMNKFYELRGLANTILWLSLTVAGCAIVFAVIESYAWFFNDGSSNLNEFAGASGEVGLLFAAYGCIAARVICVLVVGVSVIRFVWRANANLRSLGVDGLSQSPMFASIVWLIPVLNLYSPWVGMSEIYRASLDPTNENWRETSTPPLITIGWVAWLLPLLPGVIAAFALSSPVEISLTMMALSWLDAVFITSSAACFSWIVRSIVTNQEAARPAAGVGG